MSAYLTPQEVADQLKVPVTRILRLSGESNMPGAVKIGKCWRISSDYPTLLAHQDEVES